MCLMDGLCNVLASRCLCPRRCIARFKPSSTVLVLAREARSHMFNFDLVLLMLIDHFAIS
jgi:hypothetical protein